jgi:hypothetical protein
MKGYKMKHTFDIKSVLLGVILGAVIMFSVAAATTGGGGGAAWEYKIISGRLGKTAHPALAEQLDQAAAGGWEVVSTASDDGYPFVIMRKAR